MRRLAPIALVAIVMCACATEMKMTAPDLRDLGPDEGLVLGSVRIQGGKDLLGRTGWELQAEKAGGGLFSWAPVYALHASRDGDEEAFLTRMPAGSYHFFKLAQHGFSTFEAQMDVRFDVQAGKTVYVGRLVIEFPPGLITVGRRLHPRVEDAGQASVDRAVQEYGVEPSNVVTDLMTHE